MSDADVLSALEAFEDQDSLADQAAELIAEHLRRGLAERGEASFVAAGGKSPAAVYRRLSQAALLWEAVTVAPTDERWVIPSSPDSNEGFLRRELLIGEARGARLLSLWSGQATLETAAACADLAVSTLTPFDVVLLGMGEDGHFASLFPLSRVLEVGLDPDSDRFCVAVPAARPAPPQARLSLTLRALLDARLIVLMITGDAKRKTLKAVLEGADLPIRHVLVQDRAPVRILWAP
jgi:6-phosphogluconolactonase